MDECMKDNITTFLFDRSRHEYVFFEDNFCHSLLKSVYDDDTCFLYHQGDYRAKHPQKVDQSLEYMGIVSYKHGTLFDGGFRMRDWFGESIGRDALINLVTEKVNLRIQQLVNDQPVVVTEMSRPDETNRSYYLQHGIDEDAHKFFFAGETQIGYVPHFSLRYPTTDDYVRIINDELNYIESAAQEYVEKEAIKINNRLSELALIRKRIEELTTTTGEHHLRRAIIQCIKPEMKMVTVQLEKDGQVGEFKIQAYSVIRDSRDNTRLGTYSMDAPSKRSYEKLFGRQENPRVSDIIRITYGKKTLYQRDSFPDSQ